MARLFAATVDDDLRDAEYLSSLVREWAEEREEELTLALYSSAEAFLFAYEADRRLSLLFLDVEMPGMDGVELAKRVREGNREVKIIFVTGYSDYILEGYDVAALHYLMKPVAKEKLFQVLDRACREIAEDDRALYLRERDGITRIPLREIVYAEVFHNDVTIHARGIHRKRMTLGDLEKEIVSFEPGFRLAHRAKRGHADRRDASSASPRAVRAFESCHHRTGKGIKMPLFGKRAEKKLAAYQNELIAVHFAEVDNMYQKMRGWRHDYRNHIQTMKALAAAGDLPALREYLDGLETDLKTVDAVIKTGNPMADAILNSKISLAQAKGIAVTADAHIPVKLRIPEIELCTILGNLFDNAIEASLLLPEEERMIRVYLDMKGPQLYISFLNKTAVKKRAMPFGRLQSTKGGDHGLGLGRIDDTVEKLGGYISRNMEDGAFTTEILLPQ